jgi:hypothetical protein
MATEEEFKELLEQQHKWYSFTPILFEIVKEIKNRTFDMISSKKSITHFGVRYFYAGKVDYLKSHLEAMGVNKGSKLINLYHSIVHLKPNCVPVFSYDLSIRRVTKEYQEFDKNYVNFINSFDLVFDIDSPIKDPIDAWNIAKEIKKLLDEYKLSYYVKNSTRGFHFILPYYTMPEMNPLDLLETQFKVIRNIGAIYDFSKYLDTSVASHPKTLIKCAYSFSEGICSIPLNDYDFEHFAPEKYTPEYLLKNVMLKNRGLLIRDWGLSIEQLKLNTLKFIEEYK